MRDGTAKRLHDAMKASGTGKDKLDKIAAVIERSNSRRPSKEEVFAKVKFNGGGPQGKMVQFMRRGYITQGVGRGDRGQR